MSHYNGSLPVSDYWSGYVVQAQLPSTPRLALLVLLNIPIFAILLNVLWQLVRNTALFWLVNSI
jgi:sterol 14-demethylase